MTRASYYLSVVFLFVLSNNLLIFLGYPYTADRGGIFAIHPSFFCVVIAFVAMIALGKPSERSNPTAFLVIGLAGIVLFQSLLVGYDSSGDVSLIIITYLQPALLLYIVHRAKNDPKASAFTAKFINLFFIANSILALIEYVSGWRLLPFYAGSVMVYSDMRPTALIGHPLSNAILTGIYVILIAARMIERKITIGSFLQLSLGMGALLAFSSRAAIVLTVVAIALVLVRRSGFTNKIRTRTAMNALMIFYVGGLIAVAALVLGLGDQVLDRFYNATDSTNTRFDAIEMFRMMNTEQWLIGTDAAKRVIIQRNLGTQFGIEIAPIALLFKIGLLAGLLLYVPAIVYVFNAFKGKVYGNLAAVLFFFAVTATSLSIGSKSLLISQFLIMLYAFARSGDEDVPDERPLPASRTPSLRLQSLAR